jgi:hypothetical protein
MKTQNLRAIAALCRTLPESNFNMEFFRLEQSTTPECESIGCVIGHSTILETGTLPRNAEGIIKFKLWSESFTGIQADSREWRWCFSSAWAETDNSPLGAAKRIEYMLAGKWLPETFSGTTAKMVAMYS